MKAKAPLRQTLGPFLYVVWKKSLTGGLGSIETILTNRADVKARFPRRFVEVWRGGEKLGKFRGDQLAPERKCPCRTICIPCANAMADAGTTCGECGHERDCHPKPAKERKGEK